MTLDEAIGQVVEVLLLALVPWCEYWDAMWDEVHVGLL
jgi:hypothetical protein